MKLKKLMALGMAAVMTLSLTACGGKSDTPSNSSSATDNNASADKSTTGNDASAPDTDTQIQPEGIPTIDQIKVGEDYKDITASIKVLTNRTDIVDTVYAGYAQQFMEIYPNISVEYEAVTDYEEAVTLRLTAGDWGDIMFIPTSVPKNELSTYFLPLGDYNTLDAIYNFVDEKTFEGNVYGIANGGTAGGIAYNKRVWADAGITEMPKTPDEFLEDLQKIKDNTDAVPLYTNFAAGWTMGGQWDAFLGAITTGDTTWLNQKFAYTAEPFKDNGDETGAYALYKILYDAVANGLTEEDYTTTDWEGCKGMINRGEIGTMVLGSWAIAQMKEADANGSDIGYMPFPITINGKQYATAGPDYCFGINKESSADNQTAAMVFVKWMVEKSGWCDNEGGYPISKTAPTSFVFEGVEVVNNEAAPDDEADLMNQMNAECELNFNNGGDRKVQEIVEAAATGSMTYDEIMANWTERWNDAQSSLGVDVTE